MAANSPNVTKALSTNGSCTGLFLADITGVVGVNNNVDGYGISGGPTTDDVTTVKVELIYNNLNTSITYAFTLVNSVITAATLTIEAGTPANIFSQLTSTAWPFTTTLPFNLFGDYGVNIPSFDDDIYSVNYTISGTVPDTFEIEAVKDKEVTCIVQCCIDKKFVDIDWNCDCADDKSKNAQLGQSYINTIVAATRIGDLSAGLIALNKAKVLCGNNDGGCGCG